MKFNIINIVFIFMVSIKNYAFTNYSFIDIKTPKSCKISGSIILDPPSSHELYFSIMR